MLKLGCLLPRSVKDSQSQSIGLGTNDIIARYSWSYLLLKMTYVEVSFLSKNDSMLSMFTASVSTSCCWHYCCQVSEARKLSGVRP